MVSGYFVSRRIVVVFLLCVVIFSMGGVVAHAADKEELVVWMWTAHVTDLYQSWYEKFTEWFEEENPGATVRFEFTDAASGQKLVAAVAAGTPPDVSLVSISTARTFYDNGMFLDLNHYMERTPHTALDNFLPGSVEVGQKDGKIFGLPWSLEARAILYNSDHLSEMGLDDRPQALGTWDDLVSYSRLLTRRDPNGVVVRSGFVPGILPLDFATYLYSNGGTFYNDSGTAVAFNNSKGIEALEFMYSLFHEHDVVRSGADSLDLVNSTASMVIRNTSSVPTFQQQTPDFAVWLNMAPIPQGPQGDGPSTASWSNMFAIPTGAKNPDLAWQFIKLWLSPEVSEARFSHWGGANVNSARRDILQSESFRESVHQFRHMAIAPDIFNSAQPYPYIRFADIDRQMRPFITQATRGGTMAAPVALTESERLANAILEE